MQQPQIDPSTIFSSSSSPDFASTATVRKATRGMETLRNAFFPTDTELHTGNISTDTLQTIDRINRKAEIAITELSKWASTFIPSCQTLNGPLHSTQRNLPKDPHRRTQLNLPENVPSICCIDDNIEQPHPLVSTTVTIQTKNFPRPEPKSSSKSTLSTTIDNLEQALNKNFNLLLEAIEEYKNSLKPQTAPSSSHTESLFKSDPLTKTDSPRTATIASFPKGSPAENSPNHLTQELPSYGDLIGYPFPKDNKHHQDRDHLGYRLGSLLNFLCDPPPATQQRTPMTVYTQELTESISTQQFSKQQAA